MMQTWAIFYDAYRALNAKKMFWVVLAISTLIVLSMAAVGINEQGLKVLFWQIDIGGLNSRTVPPALFYKSAFINLGVGLWLTWIATILALVSTAGIFPDLITSGSIDLVVSKPISRLRLFLTQYAAGLLFVTLQVTLFTVASFLVMGFRGGVWEPGVLVAVPLVVCFFSYLFGVCVLLGLLSRSTVAALLLTLLFWFFIWAVGVAENTLLTFRTMEEQGVSIMDMDQPENPSEAPGPANGAASPADKAPETPEPPESGGSLAIAHNILYGMKTLLPKTTETMGLLDRTLIRLADLPQPADRHNRKRPDIGRSVQEKLRSRSVAWVVGTSLLFELVVVSLAAWVFCRRDYS